MNFVYFCVLSHSILALEENVQKPVYVADKSWEGGFQGQINCPVEYGQNITSWRVDIKFVGVKLNGFDCWGAVMSSQVR